MSQTVGATLYALFTQVRPADFIANLNTVVFAYEVQGRLVLATRIDTRTKNCYVVSPCSLMIDFALEERAKLASKTLRVFSGLVISSISTFVTWARVDQIQTLNNYMLSTNFFPAGFEEVSFLRELTTQALQTLPQHAVAVRSVNARLNQELLLQLQGLGYTALVTRQVYIFDDFALVQSRKNYKTDYKLLNCSRYVFEKPDLEDFARFERAEVLYNQLYLHKYSEHNVQFKARYLQALVTSGLLHLRLLHDRERKTDVAVVGLIGENGVITAPLVGYDFSYDRQQGLYRRVIAYIINYADQKQVRLNLSSGASGFKRSRGAVAELEYMLVYTQHLPWYRRLVWRGLAWLSTNFYAKLLKKYQL